MADIFCFFDSEESMTSKPCFPVLKQSIQITYEGPITRYRNHSLKNSNWFMQFID